MTSRLRETVELGDALSALLGDLRPQLTDRRARFRLLIAQDLLRQLLAEAESAAVLSRARQHASETLGFSDPAALCDAVRRRAVDASAARRAVLDGLDVELATLRPSFRRDRDLP